MNYLHFSKNVKHFKFQKDYVLIYTFYEALYYAEDFNFFADLLNLFQSDNQRSYPFNWTHLEIIPKHILRYAKS